MKNKMLFKTEIKVVVLTSKPLEFDNLHELNHIITEGDAVGDYVTVSSKPVNYAHAKRLCKKLNSDPKFLECI